MQPEKLKNYRSSFLSNCTDRYHKLKSNNGLKRTHALSIDLLTTTHETSVTIVSLYKSVQQSFFFVTVVILSRYSSSPFFTVVVLFSHMFSSYMFSYISLTCFLTSYLTSFTSLQSFVYILNS